MKRSTILFTSFFFFNSFTLSTQSPSYDGSIPVEQYLEKLFNDATLRQCPITIRSNPLPIQDIITLIGSSAGIDVVIDETVNGSVGKTNFNAQYAGDILKVLCNNNSPRLALMKQNNAWHILPYDNALKQIASSYHEKVIQKIFPLKHVHCDEPMRIKIDTMWHQINKNQPRADSYCMIDLESKKVFLRAMRKKIEEMSLFLQEIDCAVAQVRIDAIVAEVDRRYEHQFGFNWSGVYNRQASADKTFDFVGFGNPTNSTNSPDNFFALNLFNRPTTLKLPIVFGGQPFNVQQLTLELHAAELESKAKILLKPCVLTNHNETAEILIGSSVPIKTVVEDVAQGKVRNVQTVNYKDVGTILNVRPLVSPDRKSIALDIWVENSSIPEITVGDSAPVIKTIRTKNKVTLKSGQTTVIGGLMLNSDTTSKNSAPFLHKIPLIGALFRGSQTMKKENQLLIFITPTITG
jgi:type IV pilus assembly protein PilQ